MSLPADIRIAELIESIFTQLSIPYKIEEREDIPSSVSQSTRVLRTGFINSQYLFIPSDTNLYCDIAWRGTINSENAAMVLASVNEWNLHRILPVAHFFEADDALIIKGRAYYPCDLNLSEEQLHEQLNNFVRVVLDTGQNFMSWLEDTFPHSVTWTNSAQ